MKSETSINDLQRDTLSDILSRLPAKSLLSCQCVCKRFDALIRNPDFITSHLNRATSTTNADLCSISVLSFDREDRDRSFTEHMLVESSRDDQFELSFSYVKHLNPIASQFVVIGSCNGLFCVDLRAPDERCASFILLWNPITKHNRFLPKPQIDASAKGVNLVLAFGFEPETSDYKVVRIVYYHSAENSSVVSDEDDMFVMQIEVYKMSEDSWTTFQASTLLCSVVSNVSLEEDPILPLEIRKSSPVFLKGAFHWLAIDPRNHEDSQGAIVSFDLKDEQLRLITVLDSCRQGGKLVLLNELLSHIVSHQPRDGVAYDIWVMNSYGVKESWTKQFTVKESLGTLWPLGYWKEDLLLMVEIIHGKRNVFFYNLRNGARKSLPYLENFSFLGFCRYVETLVPVREMLSQRIDGDGTYNHLLDMLYHVCNLASEKLPSNYIHNNWGFTRCAKELFQSGVQIICGHSRTIVNIKFNEGELSILQVIIDNSSDIVLRNLIAFEQTSIGRHAVTSYVKLMSTLIRSQEDAYLLERAGITIKSDEVEDVSAFFKSLCREVVFVDFCFTGLCKEVENYQILLWRWRRVKGYFSIKLVEWKESIKDLKMHYFRSRWSLIGFLAASFAIILTLVQTIYTIRVYYPPYH